MQFFIFMVCLLCGIVSGVVYDVLFVARTVLCGVDKSVYTVKDKIFIIAADILYCLVFAAGFIFTSVMFDFEGLRLYMLIGCLLGALIYLKSFHLIVAFLCKKVYNGITKLKEKNGGRTKADTNGCGDNRQRDTVGGDSDRRDNLPTRFNRLRKQSKKGADKRNKRIRTEVRAKRKKSGIS
ncbi:MAG: spore cortex biosynthesis protein YabQ [Clostridia bacterium]|nr:spore cortex biosynthesis protein YabQ [Clostridia bacterium]